MFKFEDFLKQQGATLQKDAQPTDVGALLDNLNDIIEKISQDGTIQLNIDPVDQQDVQDNEKNTQTATEAVTEDVSNSEEETSTDPVDQTDKEIQEQNQMTAAEAMEGMPQTAEAAKAVEEIKQQAEGALNNLANETTPQELDAMADQVMQDLSNPEKSAAIIQEIVSNPEEFIENFLKTASMVEVAPDEWKEPLAKIAHVYASAIGIATTVDMLKHIKMTKSASLFEMSYPFIAKYAEIL